jgi:phosphatidylserine decarboxylase
MKERLFVLLQYPLPHHFLSRLVLLLTHLKLGVVTRWMIAYFVRRFDVNVEEAAVPSIEAYPSFNSFFTRALKPGVRPIVSGEGQVACPVDGTVSQAGAIDRDRLLQAKGHDYTLEALLGGDATLAGEFANGSFATLYLSPRDYHRIHMPDTGQLRSVLYVPGRLFSVNRATTGLVPGLFARNERMVCVFDTAHGAMAVVLVGALFVAGMETVWGGPHSNIWWRGARHADYTTSPQRFTYQRGEEIARFNMGSTVIVLFPQHAMKLAGSLRAGEPVRMGQLLGVWTDSNSTPAC